MGSRKRLLVTAICILAGASATAQLGALKCSENDFGINYKNESLLVVSQANRTCYCKHFATPGNVTASVFAGDTVQTEESIVKGRLMVNGVDVLARIAQLEAQLAEVTASCQGSDNKTCVCDAVHAVADGDFGGTVRAASLNVSGPFGVTGPSSFTGQTTFSAPVSLTGGVAGPFGVSGPSSFSGPTTFSAPVSLTGGVSGNVPGMYAMYSASQSNFSMSYSADGKAKNIINATLTFTTTKTALVTITTNGHIMQSAVTQCWVFTCVTLNDTCYSIPPSRWPVNSTDYWAGMHLNSGPNGAYYWMPISFSHQTILPPGTYVAWLRILPLTCGITWTVNGIGFSVTTLTL
eukprot:TRINITY_DN2332_c0_g3_i1.p1 TRINITY_DN2332_c0_g3~~TRINITY_DN2332_c0_g3_i1.p1  ORF type:complete len:349 (+),score=66.39 TRINITY_DN2332_c0_g3_i1:118-1164(+)